MRHLELTTETASVLTQLRKDGWNLNVYGMSQARAWPKVKPLVLRRLASAGLLVVAHSQYQRFANEVVRKFRTLTRGHLAAALERVIRKWVNYGFDPVLLQQLVCDCHGRFLALGYAAPETRTSITRPSRRRRRHLTYEQALRKRKLGLCPGRTVEEQAEAYEAGLERNRQVSGQVSRLLKEKGIPGREFIRYNAFAYRLDRYCRRYTQKSLDMAAAGIVDEFEGEGLDRDTLIAIAATIFGLTRLD